MRVFNSSRQGRGKEAGAVSMFQRRKTICPQPYRYMRGMWTSSQGILVRQGAPHRRVLQVTR